MTHNKAVQSFRSPEEAIELANNTFFGLAGSVCMILFLRLFDSYFKKWLFRFGQRICHWHLRRRFRSKQAQSGSMLTTYSMLLLVCCFYIYFCCFLFLLLF